jgi:hypothetical protein
MPDRRADAIECVRFASIGNDLGFIEAPIADLVGHSRQTVTSRYVHTVGTALIVAAGSIAA